MSSRPTTDLLLLIVAATIGTCCVGLIAAIAVVVMVAPDTDLSSVAGALSDVLNTLVGLVAGFLAGRTEYERRRRDPSEEPPP